MCPRSSGSSEVGDRAYLVKIGEPGGLPRRTFYARSPDLDLLCALPRAYHSIMSLWLSYWVTFSKFQVSPSCSKFQLLASFRSASCSKFRLRAHGLAWAARAAQDLRLATETCRNLLKLATWQNLPRPADLKLAETCRDLPRLAET